MRLTYETRGASALVFALGLALGEVSGQADWSWAIWGAVAAAALYGVWNTTAAVRLRIRRHLVPFEREADSASAWSLEGRDWGWLTTPAELDAYERLATENLPDRGYPLRSKLEARLARNQKLVFGVFSRRLNTRVLRGCFVVYPLTGKALRKFVDGLWDSAQPLEPSHIAKQWGSAKGIYVALVVGAGGPASGSRVATELHRFIRWNETVPVLARPATREGERLMRHFGMEPIASPEGVWIRRPGTSPMSRRVAQDGPEKTAQTM